MTDDDLVNKIGDIVDKKINRALDKKLAATEQRLKTEMTGIKTEMTGIKTEMTGIKTEMTGLKTEIVATEQRLKAEMAVSDKRVLADIGSFMEDTLFPMIDEKADKTDIARLERKLDKNINTNLDHERRIKDIEHVSVVAHELKLKKSK